MPKKLFPVFRDRDELPLSSDLGSSIEAALRASRYLVVICSPDAARSRWVNEEIRYFKSLGREDHILAIVARGIPNGTDNPATAADECFPPALRFKLDPSGKLTDERTEPIAGDLRKSGDGWRNAFLKAVAGITGMGFDAFAKREARRALRRRIVLACLGVVLLSAGLFYWDYSRLKVRHFAFATERWGVPEGVTPLSERARAGRETSFRFEYRGYKVRRVDRVKSSGDQIDDAETRASRTEVSYREDGSLERLVLRNKNGKLVLQKVFSRPAAPDERGLSSCAITFASQTDFAQAQQADAGGLTPNPDSNQEVRKSDITAHRVYFTPTGLIDSVSYRNSYGSPVSDTSGVFGHKFEYNEEGLITRITNLDIKGTPLPDRKGVQAIRRATRSPWPRRARGLP